MNGFRNILRRFRIYRRKHSAHWYYVELPKDQGGKSSWECDITDTDSKYVTRVESYDHVPATVDLRDLWDTIFTYNATSSSNPTAALYGVTDLHGIHVMLRYVREQNETLNITSANRGKLTDSVDIHTIPNNAMDEAQKVGMVIKPE